MKKKRLLKDLAETLRNDGTSKSTRSQNQFASTKDLTGILNFRKINTYNYPPCPIFVCDGIKSPEVVARCHDGIEDTIASSKFSIKAVLKRIGSFDAITPVQIQVSHTSKTEPEALTFSLQWKVLRLDLELSARHLTISDVSFLVADDYLSCEDYLVCFPVMKHSGIYSRKLLAKKRAKLNGTHFPTIDPPALTKKWVNMGLLVITRLQPTIFR